MRCGTGRYNLRNGNGLSTSTSRRGALAAPLLTQDFLRVLTDQADPILFSSAVSFWEDELDDNGLSALDARLRVHEGFFFLLLKGEVRVDNVAMRRLEKRFLVFFADTEADQAAGGAGGARKTAIVETELLFLEASWAELRQRGDLPPDRPDLIAHAANFLKPEKDVKYHQRERFTLA